MNRRIIGLSVVVAICFVAAFAYKFALPAEKPLEFASVAEARELIEWAGFRCVTFHESVAPLVVVTEQEIPVDDAFEFQARHVAIDSTGKVLLMKVKGDYDVRPRNWRTWGQVSATGDPALLDKIEKMLKKSG